LYQTKLVTVFQIGRRNIYYCYHGISLLINGYKVCGKMINNRIINIAEALLLKYKNLDEDVVLTMFL
jgi:hypothetical protein